jgi:hypothetical protein
MAAGAALGLVLLRTGRNRTPARPIRLTGHHPTATQPNGPPRSRASSPQWADSPPKNATGSPCCCHHQHGTAPRDAHAAARAATISTTTSAASRNSTR